MHSHLLFELLFQPVPLDQEHPVTAYGRSKLAAEKEVIARKDKLPDREARIRSVAFAVARSIARKGTKPQPFMVPAFRRHATAARMQGRFGDALRRRQAELFAK